MNVLLWIPRYWPAIGGAEMHTRRLAWELSAEAELAVLTHTTADGHTLAEAAAVPGHAFRQDGRVAIHRIAPASSHQPALAWLARTYTRNPLSRRLYSSLFAAAMQPAVDAVLEGFGCELIHAVYNGLTESAELAADTAENLGVPFVWTPLACTDGPLAGAWSTRRFRTLYRRANALVALTAHEREFLIGQGAPAQRVHVCPVGPLIVETPAEDLRARLGLKDEPLILFLGRVTRDKGADRLLDAAERVWRHCPDAQVLLVGPQDADMHQRLIECGDSRLHALPEVSQAEKCAALAACDLLCLPSRAESLGGVLLEAWYFAKPVIVHDLPVLREIIDPGRDGVLAGYEPDALANAIVTLLQDPARRTQMGLAGQSKVKQLYDWQVIVRRMQAVYAAAMRSHT